MKRIVSSIIAVATILTLCLTFTACSSDDGDKVTLKVYNWGDYIDETVIKSFEDKFNIKVIYDMFANNEEMFIKLKAGGSDYDVAIPSDYMIKRMIDENMLNKIDFNNVPNYNLIDPTFKDLGFDPKNEYSVPYMWGTVGIIYNKTMVKDLVDSWNILWDKKYDKQIFMLDSQRDSMAVALKKLGYSLNTKDSGQLQKAKEELIKQKDLVLAYVGDEVKDKMILEEAAMAVVWSGDAVYMKKQNPNLEYAIPKEGSNYWFDSMVIPTTAQNKKQAEMFINYMCQTDIAFKNTDYIGYSTPQMETKKLLAPELLNDVAGYPAQSIIDTCEVFKDLASTLKEYDRIWTEISSAN